MFFPISSKSLSSAELLSVSVESTSVDSNTLCWGSNKENDLMCAQREALITFKPQKKVSLVLQVKDPLAFFLVALLVFSNGETRTSGKLAHGTLA